MHCTHLFGGIAMHSSAMVSSALALSPSDLPARGLGDAGAVDNLHATGGDADEVEHGSG